MEKEGTGGTSDPRMEDRVEGGYAFRDCGRDGYAVSGLCFSWAFVFSVLALKFQCRYVVGARPQLHSY